MNVLSLFDGMSCGQIALERAGIKVNKYYASEIDKNAVKVTQHNYPNTIQIGDVTKVRYENGILYTEKGEYNVGKIDLVMGGSPCQGFSFAGKQLNFDDPRSALFFEWLRICHEVCPDYFLLENVKMKKEYQDVITDKLGVRPIEINSALVSAHTRKRLYWTNIPGVSIPIDKKIYLKHICFELSGELTNDYNEIESEIKRHTKRHVGITFHPNKNIRPYKQGKTGIGELTLLCHTDNKSNTIIKSHAPKIYIGTPFQIRKVTQIEAERLQTVPDGYTKCLSYRQAISCLGNGWTVDVIAHIFKNIEQQSEKYINDKL